MKAIIILVAAFLAGRQLADTVLEAQHRAKLREAAIACAIESSGTDMDIALCFKSNGLPVPSDI